MTAKHSSLKTLRGGTAAAVLALAAMALPCRASTPASMTSPAPGSTYGSRNFRIQTGRRHSTVSVSISPPSASLATGASGSFTATVTGSTNTAVTWLASGGTISGSGATVTYTAPPTAGTYSVTATSVADTRKSAQATVTVTAPAQVSISIAPSTTSISAGTSQSFTATVSGTTNTSVTWAASAGIISGSGGTVTYTAPSAAGTYTVTATSQADTTKSAQAIVTVTGAVSQACSTMSLGAGASLGGFRLFPSTNAWNQDISSAPVDSNSANIINYIGSSIGLHPDFSSGGGGIPYIVVGSSQPMLTITGAASSGEGDPSPMPIPANAPIEGYPNPGDNHVLVLQQGGCWLYELYQGSVDSSGNWSASFGTVWDLLNYEQRPLTWSSSDAAGLPVFAGLVRYDEVASGAINHALRFTVPNTEAAFVPPATHWAVTASGSPIPMGMRMRLKANVDISGFSASNQVILAAMKKYGIILADNGSAMYITGAPDSRWNDDDLHTLNQITASDFEVVQMNPIYTSSNIPSGAAPSFGAVTASSYTVAQGTPVTLNWTVSGASYVFISPSVGPVRGNSVTFTPTQTATYVLYATNQYGRTTASVTVTVQ